MRAVFFMAMKDLLLLWRDRFGLFWVAAFPLLFAVFFGSIFSTGGSGERGKITVAVVDMDSTDASAGFIEKLSSSDLLKLTPQSETMALESIRKGNKAAYLIIEKGYEDYFGLFAGEPPPLRIGVDPSRRAEAGYLQGIVTRYLFESMQDRMMDPELLDSNFDVIMADVEKDKSMDSMQVSTLRTLLSSARDFYRSLPGDSAQNVMGQMSEVKVETIEREKKTGPQSPYDISFPQAIIWGLIGCAASFAISIVTERSTGTLLRLYIAPVSRVHVLAGKAIACLLACLGVIAMMLILGGYIFGVNISHSGQIIMASVGSAFCFVGIMMLLSVLGKTERSVSGAGWAVLMLFAMAGGGMVPHFIMPSWMVKISYFSPVKWSIYSFEGAVWRDFSYAEMAGPFAIMIAIGLAFFIAGAVIFSRSSD